MIKYIKDHFCARNSPFSIEQYLDDGNLKWFMNMNDKLYRIFYCPYCGKRLRSKKDEQS